jgi:hypothetical protein
MKLWSRNRLRQVELKNRKAKRVEATKRPTRISLLLGTMPIQGPEEEVVDGAMRMCVYNM